MLEMMLKRMNKSKNQKGFTLVELIVVIAIIAILAAVAVGRFGGFTDKAKVNADFATAAEIASAAQAYMAEQPGANAAPSMKALADAKLIDKEDIKAQSTDKAFAITYEDNQIKVTADKVFYPKSEYK